MDRVKELEKYIGELMTNYCNKYGCDKCPIYAEEGCDVVVLQHRLYELERRQNDDTKHSKLPIQRVSGSASENGSFCTECGKSSCNGNCY